MHTLEFTYLAWGLLAVFLLAGLVLYERTGLRLGGVLVLPLLLVYAIIDLNVVAVFALAAGISLVVGQIIHHTTMLYGRRLLYIFLLTGIGATFLARQYVEVALAGFIIGLLPGLFAYNLHREGRFMEGASAFALWFGIFLGVAVAALWLFAQPVAVGDTLASAGQQYLGAAAPALGADLSAMVHDVLPGGIAVAAGFEAFRDAGGVAE